MLYYNIGNVYLQRKFGSLPANGTYGNYSLSPPSATLRVTAPSEMDPFGVRIRSICTLSEGAGWLKARLREYVPGDTEL